MRWKSIALSIVILTILVGVGPASLQIGTFSTDSLYRVLLLPVYKSYTGDSPSPATPTPSPTVAGGIATPFATPTTIPTADWPMLAYDVRRSGYVPARPPQGPYAKRWVRDIYSETGEAVSNGYQPIVVGNLVFIGTARGSMYALNLATGSTVWRYPQEGQYIGGILSSPAAVDGVLYVGSVDGYVYAVDASSGALKWRSAWARGGFWNSPAVAGDGVFIGGRDGYLYALDRSTGALRWRYKTDGQILTSPAFADGVLYFASEDMHAYAVRADGGLIWKSERLPGQTMRASYAVIAGDTVVFRSAPPDEPRNILGEGEQLLARAAGVSGYPLRPSYNRDDIPGFNWYAKGASADFEREYQAVLGYLSGRGAYGVPGRSEYQSFHVLQRSDGKVKFTAPVLWTAGNGDNAVPPVVTSDGSLWVLYRTYYAAYDVPSWFIMLAFGTMDLSTGRITLRDLAEENNPHQTQLWMIGDETTAYTIVGNRLFTNHWSGVGSIDLTTMQPEPVVGKRDHFAEELLGGARRSFPYGTQPSPWSVENGPTIAGNKVVVNHLSVISVFEGVLR